MEYVEDDSDVSTSCGVLYVLITPCFTLSSGNTSAAINTIIYPISPAPLTLPPDLASVFRFVLWSSIEYAYTLSWNPNSTFSQFAGRIRTGWFRLRYCSFHSAPPRRYILELVSC